MHWCFRGRQEHIRSLPVLSKFVRMNNKVILLVGKEESSKRLAFFNETEQIIPILIRIYVPRCIQRLIEQTRFLSRRCLPFPQKVSLLNMPGGGVSVGGGGGWSAVHELSAILISNSTQQPSNKQCFLIVSCSALSPSIALLSPAFFHQVPFNLQQVAF